MSVNIHDPKRYWNVKEWVAKLVDEGSYEDWEGFTDGEKLLAAFNEANGENPGILECWFDPEGEKPDDLPEAVAFAKDMILHWMHQEAEANDTPPANEIIAVIDFVGTLLGANFKMRSDAE